jgi:hypothetical protein
LWAAGALIAAPLAEFGPPVTLIPLRAAGNFVASLRSAGAISSQR